jgi:hypothetical protein
VTPKLGRLVGWRYNPSEVLPMLLSILSILLNIAYVVVLNISFYTDRAPMPTGQFREWHRSPLDRLNIADQSVLFYLQIVLSAVSVITSVLRLFGVRGRALNTVQLISTIASTIVFIIIMIVTSNAYAKYA